MWCTIGHERALTSLQRSLQAGRIAHAYVLSGPRHVGKMTLALDLARMVNCLEEDRPCGRCGQCRRVADGLHADVRVLGVETQEAGGARDRVTIGIDQVRDIQREASLKPFEGAYRVVIVDGAEQLSEEAANSLLKTLEEPPEQVIFVLLTTEIAGVLPTIASRCQRLELRPLTASRVMHELETRYGAEHETAEEVARLSGGRLGWALRAMKQPEMLERRAERLAAIEAVIQGGLEQRFSYAASLASSLAEARDFVRQELGLWLEWWRDALVVREGVPEFAINLSRGDVIEAAAASLSQPEIVGALEAVLRTSRHLERNVNPRLALEDLMLALPRP